MVQFADFNLWMGIVHPLLHSCERQSFQLQIDTFVILHNVQVQIVLEQSVGFVGNKVPVGNIVNHQNM